MRPLQVIDTTVGTTANAEVHWYEAHGIGKVNVEAQGVTNSMMVTRAIKTEKLTAS